jgi:hypothetical protein
LQFSSGSVLTVLRVNDSASAGFARIARVLSFLAEPRAHGNRSRNSGTPPPVASLGIEGYP